MTEVVTKEEFDELNNKIDKLFYLFKLKEEEESEKFYSNEELAEKLHLSKRTLQNYRDTGQIEFIQAGRKIFYTADAVKGFFKKNTNKSFAS